MLRLMAILGLASGLRLITRSMIRTPGDSGLPVEYQPVPLRLRQESEQSGARSLGQEATTWEDRETTTTETYGDPEMPTTTTAPADHQLALRRTTVLRRVAGLWQDRQLLDPDIWGIIRTAYYCLFSGLDCFSSRVFPMVKSFIGYQPHYPYPRSVQLDGDRNQLMSNLMKELLIGLALVSLPWVGGVGLATGRALASSIFGLATNATNYYM